MDRSPFDAVSPLCSRDATFHGRQRPRWTLGELADQGQNGDTLDRPKEANSHGQMRTADLNWSKEPKRDQTGLAGGDRPSGALVIAPPVRSSGFRGILLSFHPSSGSLDYCFPSYPHDVKKGGAWPLSLSLFLSPPLPLPLSPPLPLYTERNGQAHGRDPDPGSPERAPRPPGGVPWLEKAWLPGEHHRYTNA